MKGCAGHDRPSHGAHPQPLEAAGRAVGGRSVAEVAEHLGVPWDTVYRWIDHKRLPAHRVGRIRKFKFSEVDHWVGSGGAKSDLGPCSPYHPVVRRPHLIFRRELSDYPRRQRSAAAFEPLATRVAGDRFARLRQAGRCSRARLAAAQGAPGNVSGLAISRSASTSGACRQVIPTRAIATRSTASAASK